MNQQNMMMVGAGCLAVGLVVGFVGGKTYESKQVPAGGPFAGMNGGRGQGAGGRGMRGGFGGAIGEVVSKDATGITLKQRDGGSKVILVTSSTQYGHVTTGTIEDVVTGSNVVVNGTTNSDGSVTASMIQVRPAMPAPSSTTP